MHIKPTPLDFVYICEDLPLFTLEFGGQAIYMESHPKCLNSHLSYMDI